MKLDEIEHKIACNEMTASQVFTQMKQHIHAATGEKKETEEKEPLTVEGVSDLLEGVYDYNALIANNVRLANDRCIAYVKQGAVSERNKRYLKNKLIDAKKKTGFIEAALSEAIEGIEAL